MTNKHWDAIREEIRRRVHQERVSHGFTCAELSKKAGCNRSYVYNLETGARSPSVRALYAIADALGIAVTELLPR